MLPTIQLPKVDAGPFIFGGHDYMLPLKRNEWRKHAHDHQQPPDGDWRVWLLLGGRGAGKTWTITNWADEQAAAMPGSHGAIVGPTAADVRDVLVEGNSGILRLAAERPDYEPSKRRLTWPNGTTATLYSADEPRRLRGPQHQWAIADEVAHWRYPETWDMLMFGLRLGNDPRCAAATTPRPVGLIKELLNSEHVAVTRGTTYDNRANLAEPFFEQIISKYEGTRLGRQELLAELLDDNPDALWTRAIIDYITKHPPLQRIVVGVDPPGSATGAECGIVADGKRGDDLYVLEDASIQGSPERWGRAVVTLYHKLMADCVVAEVNNGGDMVEHVIRTIDRSVNVVQVRATRGKYVRAEPVAAIYEQGRGHHVGTFSELEDQMCQWDPSITDSPDRLDAHVWAATELMLSEQERKIPGVLAQAITRRSG